MHLDGFIVRVCLDEGIVSNSIDNNFAILRCKGGFIIEDYQNAKIKKVITKDTIKLSLINGNLHVNNKKYFLGFIFYYFLLVSPCRSSRLLF